MIEDDPQDESQRRYRSGRTLLADQHFEEAAAALQQSAALRPHFKTLELLGEAWLRAGQPRRAIVPLAAATTLNEQVRAPALLAEALAADGEPVQAYRIALLALSRDPTNRMALEVQRATKAAYDREQGR